jgi:hypothetical protein
MPSALSHPTVYAVLDRLFANAEVADAELRRIEESGSEGDGPATPPPGSDIYVREPGNGYVSVRVPIGDGIELSTRTP